jgi:DHA1 family bicyclomycin/chloramphenicol resistance-like MFS transporter
MPASGSPDSFSSAVPAARAAHAAPRAAGPASHRTLAVTLGAMSAFGPFAIDMYLPAFPRIAQDLGTTTARVQITLAIFLLGLAVGQVFWGTLSDHWGRRKPLLLGCLLFSAMAVVCAVAPSIRVLIAARFLMGVGGSAGVVVGRAIVRDLFEQHEAARFYSMMMIIGGIGPIISPFLGGLLLTYFDWHGIFWAVAGFGGLCLAAVASNVAETLPPGGRVRGHLGDVARAYGRVLANRRFLAPALAIGCTSGILFTYISNASFIFIEYFGVPVHLFGVLFATNAIGLYVGGQSNRWLLRRFTSEQLLHAGLWLSLSGGAVLVVCATTHWGGFPLLFAVLFVCLSSLGIVFPNATATALQPFAADAGSASALLGICQFILGAAGGALVSVFHNGTALPMALQIAIYALVARSVLVLLPRGDAARGASAALTHS